MKKLFFLSDWFHLLSFLANLGERDTFNLTQNLPSFSLIAIERDSVFGVDILIFHCDNEYYIRELDAKFTYSKFVKNSENIITSSIMTIENEK